MCIINEKFVFFLMQKPKNAINAVQVTNACWKNLTKQQPLSPWAKTTEKCSSRGFPRFYVCGKESTVDFSN